MKFSLRELSPIYFRAVTMTGGALMLLAWYRLRGVPMRLPRSAMLPVLLLALPNIFGWHLFSILGVQELASGRAATLGFTMPIWTVLLGALFFGQGLSRRALVGMACAGAAVALLVAHEVTALAGRPLGVLWMQLAAVSWALGTILMRRSTLKLPTEALTVWMMGLSSAGFWLVASALEPAPSWRFSAPMWAALLWGAASELRRRPGHLVRPGALAAAAGEHLRDHGGAAGRHAVGGAHRRRGARHARLRRRRFHHAGDRQRAAAEAGRQADLRPSPAQGWKVLNAIAATS